VKNNIPFESELCTLFYNYRADKCPQILHSYSPEYFRLLSPLRQSAKKILEIGIGSKRVMQPIGGEDYVGGASLRAWRDFFTAAEVFGVDIDADAIFTDERIQCFQADQSDTENLLSAVYAINQATNCQTFDVIIDDGSHVPEHMISSFNALWPYVAEGGFYIIEDIQFKDSNLFLDICVSGCEKYVHLGTWYWDCFIAFKKVSNQPSVTFFETRDEMLSIVPRAATIAELGVFNGDFSEKILKINMPRRLVLIDYWGNGEVMSGDANGNNVQFVNGQRLYNKVKSKFSVDSRVQIQQGLTSTILRFPDNYFDMVYIDADHSYPAVLNDLEAAYLKVKPGGWIMGHDYDINNLKTSGPYTFGVKQSVHEFCFKYNQTVSVKAMDGCVGFGIKADKTPSSAVSKR
jgi:cephalosporin hydroxylase